MSFWNDPRRQPTAARTPQPGDKACVDCKHYDCAGYGSLVRCRAPQNEKTKVTYSWTHGEQKYTSSLFLTPADAREDRDGCGPDAHWFEAGESHAKKARRHQQEIWAAKWREAEHETAAHLEDVRSNGT